jgi:hypothetical protein
LNGREREQAGYTRNRSLLHHNTQHDRHRNSQRCSGPRPRRPQHSYVLHPATTPPSTHAPLGTGRPCRSDHRPGMLTSNTAATRQEMSDAKLPLAYRDSCAHLLIPLNKCRPANWYLPWKCQVRPPSIRRISSARRSIRQENSLTQTRMRGIHTRSASTRSSS